uniref:Uncharacterized protein n=1 Tax=Anopheles maculatus TaxID=74869 RepID=A0A182S6K1_9DIPT
MLLVLRNFIKSLNCSGDRSELWYFFISVDRMASCWLTMILCCEPRSLYQADFCRIACTSICGMEELFLNGPPPPVVWRAAAVSCSSFSACRLRGSTRGPLLIMAGGLLTTGGCRG